MFSRRWPGADRAKGGKARFFLVGLRPGMLYETGAAFAPAVQIDPILPAAIKFALTYPDGRQVTAEGVGDRFGSFVGKDRWTLDVPGIYRYTLEATWEGHQGYMPGLPKEGGVFYVIEKDRPAGAPGLKLDLPPQSSFDPKKGLIVTGASSAKTIQFAAVIPGAVIDQGTLEVQDGKSAYRLDPAAFNKATLGLLCYFRRLVNLKTVPVRIDQNKKGPKGSWCSGCAMVRPATVGRVLSPG